MMRIALLAASVACVSGSGWVRCVHAKEKRNATRPQLQPVTSEDVARYFAQNDLDGLCAALRDHFSRTARQLGPAEDKLPLREALVAKGAGAHYSSAYKLQHDIEQLRYVSARNATVAQYLAKHAVIERLERVQGRIPPLDELARTNGLWAFRPEDVADVGDYYNRAIHVPDPVPVSKMLNAQAFKDADAKFREGPFAIDDALTPAALQQIRSLLLESTVFFETKMPAVFGGYVGAIVEDGLHARALLELAGALQRAMPETLGKHPLAYLWCYKYDSQYEGISVHADEAAVNLNIWLTPDDANLDPASGGLVVYTAKPPESATAEEYNQRGGEYADELLRSTGYANVTIPYRQNRIVVFDSALYHKTDSFKFKEGYENRRINLTLLFGKMRRGEAGAGEL